MGFADSFLQRIGPTAIVLALIGVFLFIWGLQLMTDPLRDIPGPFWARYTRLWLLWQYVKGDFQKTNVELHEKYGPLIRISPNQYSIDDPKAAKIIYGHGTNFTKSDWYIPWGHKDPTIKNMFNDRDPASHSETRRKVASAYSMSSLVSYEPLVDECTAILLQRLSDFATSGAVVNMGHWFQCFAFEMIGNITFSTKFGFLNAGEDVKGMMSQLEMAAFYSSCVGLFPSWHRMLVTIIESFTREVKGMNYITNVTEQMIEERKNEIVDDDKPSDFLIKFLAIQRENPAKMSKLDIFGALGANMVAGSDTTSISLSAILYQLCKNREVMVKLQEELDHAAKMKTISNPITFQEAQSLPYLQAVIKEGLRMHPATGFTMPRIVPHGGREMVGRYFPEGTTVGINAWVAHQNQEVFGRDAKSFRPERWLEGKELFSQQDSYFMSFGQGSRTCIGKNISLFEISKTIPQIVRYMDFHVENDGEWTCVNNWFVKPKDFTCRVTRRKF